MSNVVCNASPLIVLAKAKLLDVIPRIFGRAFVPYSFKTSPDQETHRASERFQAGSNLGGFGSDRWPIVSGQNQNGEFSPDYVLLEFEILVRRDEHLKSRFRLIEQDTIF